MTHLTITLDLPPKELSPNYTVGSRGQRMAKANKIKKYRQAACLEACHHRAVHGYDAPQWSTATAQAWFYFATKRRRDGDNLLASLKPAFDGLRDAGIIADDSGLTHKPVILDHDADDPRVVIHLEAQP